MNGEQQRQAIIEALRDHPQGLDTNQLAEQLGVHPNTVRWHLGHLADENLVQPVPQRRHTRGRPSIVYRLTGEGVGSARDEYRLLATMLTDVVARDRAGQARAYEAGIRWGRHLRQSDPDANIAELLDREGFEAQQDEARLHMRRCPFYALAEASPQVICTLHHGIIDGALAEAGSQRTVERLEPFAQPDLCIAHLSPDQT